MKLMDTTNLKYNGVNLLDATENQIIDMLKNDVSFFGKIPKSKLTEDICSLAVMLDYNVIMDIPDNFKSEKVMIILLYYWGSKIYSSKYFEGYDIDLLVVKAILKYKSMNNINIRYMKNRVFDLFMELSDTSEYLSYTKYYDRWLTKINIEKLYKKYGKEFLNNININISLHLYHLLSDVVGDIHYDDFHYHNLHMPIIIEMLNKHPEDILVISHRLINKEIVDIILKTNNATYIKALGKLEIKNLTKDQADILKGLDYFCITNIPSEYLSTDDYISRLTKDDNIRAIPVNYYNEKLVNIVVSYNIKNLDFVPERFYTQDLVREYGLKSRELKKDIIDKINWDDDYTIRFVAAHPKNYFRYVDVTSRKNLFNGRVQNKNVNDATNPKTALAYFAKFCMENYQSYDYIFNHSMKQFTWTLILNSVEKNYPQIYDCYLNLINPSLLNDSVAEDLVNYLVKRFRYGTLDNGKPRKFTILDYYLYTDYNINDLTPFFTADLTKYSKDSKDINELKNSCRAIENLKLFEEFKAKFKKGDLQTWRLINLRGKNINGKEVINDSEFKQILKFIEANGMALNLEIYNEVLRAYLAGKIDINKVYSKKVVNTYNESKNRLCKDLLSLLNDAIESDLDVKTELTKIYELKKERKM